MTTPNFRSDSSEFSFTDWLEANRRAVSIAGALVAAAVVGGWFYMRSAEIKRMNAERSLAQAKQSIAAGNKALAATDLQRVATRYKGTPGGATAALLLAQVHYDDGKFAEGIAAMAPYRSSSAAGASLPEIWALTGDGQLMLGQGDSAVASFQRAAGATDMPGARAAFRARAARALMIAGKPQEARAIWEQLAADPEATIVKAEAEIRIGELAARQAAKP